MSRYCPHCHYNKTIRYGQNSAKKQRYKCMRCHKTWVNQRQSTRDTQIWNDFVLRGCTVDTLSQKYNLHPNTIRRIIHNYPIDTKVNLSQLSAEEKARIKVIMLDATYLGSHEHCIIVVIDAHTGRLLYFQEVFHTEKVRDYYDAILTLRKAGIRPLAGVIDGRKGIREVLEAFDIKVQYCLFHVQLLEKKCLTSRPVLQPNIELKDLVSDLCRHGSIYHRDNFSHIFAGWRIRHAVWLAERSPAENKRGWEYTHERTRRLVRSITNNHHWYFTYEEYPDLKIPRTSSHLEGLFGMAKTRALQHRGCKSQLKIKILFYLLSVGTGVKNN